MPNIKMLSDDLATKERIDNYRVNCIGWEGANNDPDHKIKVGRWHVTCVRPA
jgi:hypothetical protein